METALGKLLGMDQVISLSETDQMEWRENTVVIAEISFRRSLLIWVYLLGLFDRGSEVGRAGKQ